MPAIKGDFKLGADPEFVIATAKGNILKNIPLPQNGQLGLDGCLRVAELRPDPAYDPKDLVENIRDLLGQGGIDRVATAKWWAGNYKYGEAIGGHIHFGIGTSLGGITADHITRILSTWVGSVVALIEDRQEAIKRLERGYGGFSDHRIQPWGMEYRTLGSWLSSPEVALGVLSLAKVVMYEIRVNKLDVVNPDINQAITNRDMNLLLNFYKSTILKKLPTFALYKTFKKDIEIIHDLISDGKTWFPDGDMKKAWGINYKKPKVMTVEEIWGM